MSATTGPDSSIAALADACAAQIPASPTTFDGDHPRFASELQRLIAAIRASDPRFDFDRVGRPGAVAAIRQALPAVEADLLDAIMEDMACELAAVQEAMYHLAVARRGTS